MRIELRFVAPEGTTTERPILQFMVMHPMCNEPDPWTNVPTVVDDAEWQDALAQRERSGR